MERIMGLFNSDMAGLEKQLRDLSYDLGMLSINVEYLFANQRHLIEYLASMNKIDLCYRSKDLADKLEYLRGEIGNIRK
jgi:hypothetical protein